MTLRHAVPDYYGIQVLVKREDMNHPNVSGNKYWKLKYNLAEALACGYKTILTFGGAYSNHIYATAAAASLLGIRSVGVIRGEFTTPLNPTLSFAQSRGMVLHYTSRENYRRKTTIEFLQEMRDRFGEFYCIPEGGTNDLAIKGVVEFASGLRTIPFDVACVAAGTGGTIAGLTIGLPEKHVIGVPVFKDGNFMYKEVEGLLAAHGRATYDNWSLWPGYGHGGYAKTSPELIAFMRDIYAATGLPLDHVYTAKVLFALFEEIQKKSFTRGTTVLVIHTGGLQGTLSLIGY